MEKMTCDSAGSCDLSVYLKALGMHGHSTNEFSPTVLNTGTSHMPADTVDSNNEINLADQQQDIPSIPLPEEDQALNSDGQPPAMTAHIKSEQSSNEDANSLKHAEETDEELTDVSSCNDPSECRPFRMFRDRHTQSGKFVGNMSDSEDDGRDISDGIDTASTTELGPVPHEPGREKHAHKMRKWKTLAKGRFEKMLLDCIVNTDKIAPNYREIHISQSTIHKLEQVTSLSLLRPKAFSQGVLKGNKVTGAILYGPPGTGKSLLARGMAKQSRFNMLSISTSEIWQKCHGEDEKMIKAVFSMARKLHPCVVFVDEADAMLGARKAGERRHVRSMLNQFLMEWDGLVTDTTAPFVLLATNRPFDLDPAVLRRAPVQIHLNIPTTKERIGILSLLLREEKLQHGISLSILANLTQNYTGSDLKNLCVMAATNCVHEQPTDTTERVLTRAHFFMALESIRATNMGKVSTNEFKKFEERLQENNHTSGGNEEED